MANVDHAEEELAPVPGCKCSACIDKRVGELVHHALTIERAVLNAARYITAGHRALSSSGSIGLSSAMAIIARSIATFARSSFVFVFFMFALAQRSVAMERS